MNQFERLEPLYFEYLNRVKDIKVTLNFFNFCQLHQLIEINNSIRNIESLLVDIKRMVK
jgi:hypothetical protein